LHDRLEVVAGRAMLATRAGTEDRSGGLGVGGPGCARSDDWIIRVVGVTNAT
jgi:hypothetical protein